MKQHKSQEKKPLSLTRSLETRSFRVGGYSVAATALVLAIAVVINVLASALPVSLTQFDATSNQLYSLSEQTETLLKNLEQDVTIYYVVQGSQENSTLENLLSRYEGMSSHVTVVKKDPDVYPAFVQTYTDSVQNNSLIVESGTQYRYISYSEIYEYDYSNYYYTGSYDVNFAGESVLTSAIDYVTRDNLPKLYLLTGHGESSLSSTFSSAVEKENLTMESLSLLTLEAVPEDADGILINAPQSDLSTEEVEQLRIYLQSGGHLMLITDPPQEGKLVNLESLMADYGVTAEEGIVVEGSSDHSFMGTPYYLLPDYGSHAITASLSSGGYYVLLGIAQGLTVSSDLPEGVSVTKLLTTSSAAFSKLDGYQLTTYEKEEGDIDGPFALAVAITQTIDEDTKAEIVWVSSSSLVEDAVNQRVSGGNQDFFLNCLNWMCQDEEQSSLSIHAKSVSYSYLTMSSSTSSLLTGMFVAVIPLCFLAVGITVWIRRKRK